MIKISIYEIITKRRTIRKFTQEKVSRENALLMINAARLAPCGGNMQGLKYIVVLNDDTVNDVFDCVKWAAYLKGEYTPNVNERPTAFIAVLTDSAIRPNGGNYDIGAAVQNLMLTGEELGIGSCWMRSIDKVKISEILNIEEPLILDCVIAIGYKAETPREVNVVDNDIKYYLDENGLCVPKRSIEEVMQII